MIQLRDITKQIGNRIVLDHVTAQMSEETVTGFQGINGSGKTMLMRVIAGLVRPTSGSVSINGKRLGRDLSMPESMGTLIENPVFLDSYTGLQNLELLASLKGRPDMAKLREWLAMVGLDPDDRRKYKKYSLGMKQRLGIAAAVMGEPDVVLLDEPTNALDETGLEMLREIVLMQKRRGAIVILASHDRFFLESLADKILVFEDGQIQTLRQKADVVC